MRRPRQSVWGFSEAIEALIAEPEPMERLSSGALPPAEELRWDWRVDEGGLRPSPVKNMDQTATD